jgi:hypothetical protein
MNRFRLRRPSAALVVSVTALMVALGGTAYAGLSVPNNSVGAKQLEKNAVNTKNIKNGAITGAKIANGTVTGKNIKLSKLGTVPSANHANTADNATNATNATNSTNAITALTASALASVTYVSSASITSPACGPTLPCAAPSDTPGSIACPTGTIAIGGGFTTSGAGVEINESQPTGSPTAAPTGWNGFIDNFTTTARTFTVHAICTHVASPVPGVASSASKAGAVR